MNPNPLILFYLIVGVVATIIYVVVINNKD